MTRLQVADLRSKPTRVQGVDSCNMMTRVQGVDLCNSKHLVTEIVHNYLSYWEMKLIGPPVVVLPLLSICIVQTILPYKWREQLVLTGHHPTSTEPM